MCIYEAVAPSAGYQVGIQKKDDMIDLRGMRYLEDLKTGDKRWSEKKLGSY